MLLATFRHTLAALIFVSLRSRVTLRHGHAAAGRLILGV